MKRINFTLTATELSEIEQAITESVSPEVRQRAIAIRLLHLGYSPEAVATMVLVTANTIYAWHRHWREGGLAGLADQQRTGRPSRADANYRMRVEQLLKEDPASLNLPFNIWTINRLRLYLAEETGILLSYTRFRSLLSRMGYRWKQPKHDLSHLQDASAQATAEAVLDWLKKTSRLTRLPRQNSSLWTKRP